MQFANVRKASAPLTATLSAIPDGKAGTLATLRVMRDLVRVGKKSLAVRTLAVQLSGGLDQKDWIGEIRALHAFVRDRIRYIRDINDVETVQTPDATLTMRAGDCDDKSTLLAAMLESIGHPTRLVAIGFTPEEFDHVYIEARVGNNWLPLETTEPVEIGWSAPGAVSRMVMFN